MRSPTDAVISGNQPTGDLPALKSCPFCGSNAEYFQNKPERSGWNERSDTVGVRCTQCTAIMQHTYYAGYEVEQRQQRMAEQWNTRQQESSTGTTTSLP